MCAWPKAQEWIGSSMKNGVQALLIGPGCCMYRWPMHSRRRCAGDTQGRRIVLPQPEEWSRVGVVDCYFADQFFDSQSVSNLVSAAALALLCLQWFLAAVPVCHTLPGLAPSCWSCLCVQSVCLALAATKVSSCLRGFLWPYSHCLECISFICCSTSFFLQFCLLNKEKNLRLKCEGDHNWS